MATNRDDLEQVAAAFDRDTDPLLQYESTFREIEVDPFDAYIDLVLNPDDASDSTLKNYRQAFSQWKSHMDEAGRHPACPHDGHIKSFAKRLSRDRDNIGSTIEKKVNNVARAYRWWQAHQVFPHPKDYDPFSIAKSQIDFTLGVEETKHPRLTPQEVGSVVRDCTHVRERLFLAWPLKLGIRAGELLNIQLQDIAVSHPELKEYYPEMGTAEPLREYENAVYIPSRENRDGNKSYRPRILPLDDEARRVLLEYLPTRQPVDEPWLILSQRTYDRISDSDHVSTVWKKHFAEINDADEYQDSKNITSHYGRYFFTNYWKIHQDIPRELVQYMRGDKLGNSHGNESIDEYLTAYYEDIEEDYLEHIFKLF